MLIKGRVWVFGDDVNADQIMPVPPAKAEEEKYRCLESLRPEFARAVQPGDVIVAGRQCGIGSSRPSPRILKALQLGAVIADSFSGIFFRNAIAIGFPLVEMPGAQDFLSDENRVEIDFESGIVRNVTTGVFRNFEPYSPFFRKIIAAGGITNTLRS